MAPQEQEEGAMLDILSRYWWALALRGAIAVIFGIGALVWPSLMLTVLVLLFGAYALVDGIFAGIRAAGRPGGRRTGGCCSAKASSASCWEC
jgi:uncharacterized membrane protein HdeD (DUF308 family)